MIEYKGKELWTYFFNKQKINYNPYMFQMPNYENLLYFSQEEILSFKGKWSSIFANTNDIYFEIGSGSANFLLELATRRPNCNYIGDELRFKRLIFSARKAKNKELKNIKFIRFDASQLDKLFSENELAGLYINFPDPWEKNEKKRIISNDLLDKIYPLLKAGGKIYFKTDHLAYYNSVLELVDKHKNFKVAYHTTDLHSTDLVNENIMTEFEHLFTNKLKIKIKYIEISKCGN